jgi:ABC-type multidrug transport system ATPase subunit
MIKLIELNFGYDELLFSNLNLEIQANEITLLHGANGSGKTTFCRLLSGLETKYSGKILLNNEPLSKLTAKEISQKLIYLKQEPIGNTVAATPDEDLAIWQNMFSKNLNEQYKHEREDVLAQLKIGELMDSPFWEMSGGQIKRSTIAALLLSPQKFWILDEPTSGLHQEIVDKLISILEQRKQDGFGALIITHKIDQFQTIFDRVLKIQNEIINEISFK